MTQYAIDGIKSANKIDRVGHILWIANEEATCPFKVVLHAMELIPKIEVWDKDEVSGYWRIVVEDSEKREFWHTLMTVLRSD